MNYELKKLFVLLALIVCAGKLPAQTYTYTDTDEWQAYDDFNRVFLDTKNSKYIYRDHSARATAVDRWNGAAAIWCQAIFYDMAVNAYRRAVQEDNATRKTKYKTVAQRIYSGEKKQYCNFDFDNNNTNTGWFVYDDIMWWTCALARAHEAFGGSTTSYPYRSEAERSFLRVWYGSPKVGDDGSYADPARGLGGGMFWEWQPIDKPKAHKAGDFRSACINFPTVIAACLLHKIVPEGRTEPTTAGRPTQQTKEWYLEKAKEVFEWADKTLVSNGRVADGIHGGGPEFKDHLYNQATYIGACCHLYLLTGEETYLVKANRAANYVFNTMCSSYYLPLETGVEQGIYAAIFAQYISMLVYDCGQSRYASYIRRNIQKAWTNRDQKRGIHNANFRSGSTKETDQVESYNASGMPALMLMFPVGEATGIEELPPLDEPKDEASAIYTIDGKSVLNQCHAGQSALRPGLYVMNHRKILVR